MAKWIMRAVSHPASGIVIGILIALYFYSLSISRIEPRYAIMGPEALAMITLDSPRLELRWDGRAIENVQMVRIALWNSGRSYLDNAAIPKESPIRIEYPRDVQVLSATLSAVSRPSLILEAREDSIAGAGECLRLDLAGDEALERHDGGVFTILYTGPAAARFVVA